MDNVEDYIIHLRIDISELDSLSSMDLLFAPMSDETCYKEIDKTEEESETQKDINEVVDANRMIDRTPSKKRVQIDRKIKNTMLDFIHSNKRKEWLSQTDISCWWCCHQFDTPPVAIPRKFVKGVFHVYGCFCSFNCAVAYNFSKSEDIMWESNSLLYLLYKKMYNEEPPKKIHPAPDRECLEMFGGPVSIEEYRDSFVSNKKAYRIIVPPMLSIIPKLEENHIRYGDTSYVPTNNVQLEMDKHKLNIINKEREESIAPTNTLASFIKYKS